MKHVAAYKHAVLRLAAKEVHTHHGAIGAELRAHALWCDDAHKDTRARIGQLAHIGDLAEHVVKLNKRALECPTVRHSARQVQSDERSDEGTYSVRAVRRFFSFSFLRISLRTCFAFTASSFFFCSSSRSRCFSSSARFA